MPLWAGLTELWSERRVRRSIVRQFKPLFEYSLAQHGKLIETRWCSDYGVGLIAMLVLLVARRSDPDLESEALGRLQVDSWSDLTGLDPVEVGARITLLSSSDDAKFSDGCRAAIAFDTASHAGRSPSDFEDIDGPEHETADRIETRRELWDRAWRTA